MRDNNEVLARKYRPKSFKELIGQESISQTLSLALDSNRLSHAYLFSGLRGSGKTSTARIFAKALICQKGISHEPCGECENCIMASEGRHIDIVEMDGASSRKIDDIRDLIEQTKYKPSSARFKIFIIDEVHMLTKEAFNALLKTLEEPPEYVKFILATTDPLKLPATILSRTQHFRFKSIAVNKIVDHLSYILNLENITYDQSALEILARSGGGSLRDTLTMLDQAIIYSKGHVDVKTVTDMLGLVDPDFIAKLFEAVFSKDYAKIVEFVKVLEDYESEMVIDELIAYLKDKMYNRDAVFSTLVIERFFRILSDSKYLFSINADGSFVLSLVFFKMVEALKIKEIDQMIETLQSQISMPKQESISIQPVLPQTHEQSVVKHSSGAKELFETLKSKIKDRNAALGECFADNVSFVSFENNVLKWESCAENECKKVLTHGFSVIKQLTKEIFGIKTSIKGVACLKQKSQKEEQTDFKKQEAIKKEETEAVIDGNQSGSTMQDIEMSNDSCVNNCTDDAPLVDGKTILEDPFVKKAVDMFEAKATVFDKM